MYFKLAWDDYQDINPLEVNFKSFERHYLPRQIK